MGEFAFQTLRESITSAIRSKILTGELQPGVKLAEQKLAEEFGSSRAPIREALRQLEQEGMVEYSRNVGCSVRRVKPEDAYEIYLLRANLEMTALRYFDCKFLEEDLRTLRGILEDRSRKAHKWLYFPLQAYPCGFLFPAPVRHPTQLSTTYRQFGVKVV